jgi:2,5-diamino-6-(ribosylamino)-4(3H)-pyrimidinone 5'-phosphate reductase
MKLPEVIIHNSVSLDGSLTGFEPNMGMHYQLAARYKPGAHLIGSNTMKMGVELYGHGVPPEEKRDLKKPRKDPSLPYWVIPDTRGMLMGLLHAFRRFEFCRDIIILLSDTTPEAYLRYLEEREYGHHIVGEKHVDLNKSLALLADVYEMRTVLADTGRILSNLLMEQDLVSEISLLVHPIIVGKDAYNMFSDVSERIDLELLRSERLNGHFLWMVFRVKA